MIRDANPQAKRPVQSGNGTSTARRRTVMQTYRDQTELRSRLRELDAQPAAGSQTVILQLEVGFSGHLPSLIRRRNPGARLFVTSAMERLPGLVSGGDIAFRAAMLGWGHLAFVSDLNDAVDQATRGADPESEIIFLKPMDSNR